jgi:hypothetical protein
VDSRISIPNRGKIFLFSIASSSALEPTQPPIQSILGTFSPGVKRPKRESDHYPPCGPEIKNGGAVPPLPNMSSWHSA